jgi:hypothetical protein
MSADRIEASTKSRNHDAILDPDQTSTHRPAIKHFAVLTAFILPITLVPYLLVKRRLFILRQKVDGAGLAMTTCQGDLKRALLEVREENARVQAALEDVKLDLEKLREETDARRMMRAASDDMIHSDIWKLLEERKQAG